MGATSGDNEVVTAEWRPWKKLCSVSRLEMAAICSRRPGHTPAAQ